MQSTNPSVPFLFLTFAVFFYSEGYSQSHFHGKHISGSVGFEGYVWYEDREYEYEEGILKVPTEEERDNIAVEWNLPTVDPLDRFCTLSGTLRTKNSKGLLIPIYWQQMIAVHLAIKAGVQPDWTRGTDFRTAMGEVAMVQQDGTFEVILELNNCKPRLGELRELQAGISLPQQTVRRKGNLMIEYRSSAPVLDNSLTILQIPAPAEIPPILREIARVSHFPSDDAHAVHLIQVANSLRQLGKDEALKALEQYQELSMVEGYPRQTRILCALALSIFEPADPEMSMILLNGNFSGIAERALSQQGDVSTRREWPRFPIEIVDGMPWLYSSDYQDLLFDSYSKDHLKWFRQHCIIRETPLKPVKNPLEAVESMLKEPRFQQLDPNHRREAEKLLKRQAYSMVRDLFPPLPLDDVDEPEVESHWDNLFSIAKSSALYWSEDEQAYKLKSSIKP